MKTEIRAFIAIELPNSVKDFLREIVDDLKKYETDIRWVKIEGMHLTLKFLGSVPVELISQIEHASKKVFTNQPPVELHVAGLGAFPDLKRPRVIWAGCQDVGEQLKPLVTSLENALEPLGFAKEKRPFNPHFTLGRVKSSRGITNLVPIIKKQLNVSGPTFTTDHAVLFESILKPSGAEYVEICRFNFITTDNN